MNLFIRKPFFFIREKKMFKVQTLFFSPNDNLNRMKRRRKKKRKEVRACATNYVHIICGYKRCIVEAGRSTRISTKYKSFRI